MTRTLWVACKSDGTGANGLVRFAVDGADVVERTGSWDLPSPGWFDSHEGIVYASLHTEQSSVVSLRLTAEGPEFIAQAYTRGSDACHHAINPTGRLIAVAHYTSGSVALVGASAQGELQLLDLLEFTGHSAVVPERQEAPHAHHCHWLASDQLLVCDLGADQVRRLQVVDGHLVEDLPIQLPDGFGPRHLVSRRRGEGIDLAIVGELTGEVATVALDGEGRDTLIGVFPGTANPAAQPSGIRLDRGGRLWVGQRTANTLAVMDWMPDGTVGPCRETPTVGEGIRDLVPSPAWAPVTVWAALKASNEIRAFVEQGDTLVSGRPAPVHQPMALLFEDEINA